MKITVISYDNWGFNKHIVNSLIANNHEVKHIDFSKFKYKYPNFLFKIYNFTLKTFFKQNLKTKFYGKCILSELDKNQEKQDLILTIKGDFIAPEYAKQIKNYTKKSTAFFNDNIKRCPKIIGVLNCFDEVYSFEKEDCEKYNLKHKTNFIYNFQTGNTTKEVKTTVFNVSSIGKRIELISKIASELKRQNILYNILIFDKKNKLKNNSLVTSIQHTISLEEVNDYISNSSCLLDLQRKNQSGLSFRVFESMGLHKKLITTNSSIKNYEFYNENNILIIDSSNPIIDADFCNKPYQAVPATILEQYKLTGWINDFLV
ncbi:hypothetical protein ACFSX9_04795 [Flavobacterium ardleyense]|uniref:Uncharacterized protein n=1 Tax=Flavobacterium ardleyense TaxID=2038737 RepID=A0ABW5Z6J7_9FLAO